MFQPASGQFSIPVTLMLMTGDRLRGQIVLSRKQSLIEVMNKPEEFIEFEGHDGRTLAIAKHSIASAEVLDMPQTDQLKDHSTFDGYKALGVMHDASQAEIREAYLAKVRLYHPDHHSSSTLPKEVEEYLRAMFIHIQMAYEELAPRSKRVKAETPEAPETATKAA